MLTEKEFQNAAANGWAIATQCDRCGRKETSILAFCPACGSGELKVVELPQTGKILTYTVQTVSPEPFQGDIPHAVAVVELDDGTRTMGRMEQPTTPSSLPQIGGRVRITPSSKGGLTFKLET